MITLPEGYKRLLDTRNNFINRFIIIDNKVYISENKININVNDSVKFFEDRDLSISSIKQSVNLQDKNFKISDVSINISNFQVDGIRFSQIYKNKSLINKSVVVYYSFGLNNNISIDDCLKIFEGKVRRYEVSEKTVSFTVEDVSQEKLHKQLPLAKLPDSEKIQLEYRNKPVPMVFGYNDKSPLVFYKDDVFNKFYLLADNSYHDVGDDTLGAPARPIFGFIENEDIDFFESWQISEHTPRPASLRAYKGAWLDVYPIRKTFATQYLQYVNKNSYLEMELNTASEQALQRAIDSQTTDDKSRTVAMLQVLSPVTNNIFEGVVEKKATGFNVLEESLPESEGQDAIEYQSVDVDVLSEEPLSITLPTIDTTEPIISSFQILALDKVVDSNYDVPKPMSESDGHICAGVDGALETYEWAKERDTYITRLPRPEEINNFLFWASQNGYLANDILYDDTIPPINPNTNIDITRFVGDCVDPANVLEETTGRLISYESLNLQDNRLFNEWWLGVDENGVLGAEYNPETGTGNGPVIKTWDEAFIEEILDSPFPYTFEGDEEGQYYTVERKRAHITPGETYRNNLWSNGSFLFGNGVAYFNTETRCYNHGGVAISSPSYEVLDPNFQRFIIGKESGFSSIKSSKISFNFSDITSEGLLSPILDSQNNVLLDVYKPSFKLKMQGTVNRIAGSPNVVFRVDNFTDDLVSVNISSVFTGFLDVSLDNTSPYFGDGIPEKDESWLNPNTYNEIGIEFDIINPSFQSTQAGVQLAIQSPSLIHYANYSELNLTHFYGRVGGRMSDDELFLLESPADIIISIFKNDLNYQGPINQKQKDIALEAHPGWKLGFTVNEEINSKNLISEISANTRLFPKFRPHDGTLSFVTYKANYGPQDIDLIINPSDVINYKFNLTDIDDVKTKVKVLYKKDVELDVYEKSTEFITAKELMLDYNLDYYGLDNDDEDTRLEIESDYIRDEYTANQLRDFLCMYNANQSLIMDVELPLAYSHLETGDVVYISDLINNFEAYGIDYSSYNYINGQIMYPYFIIQSISIGKTVNIVAHQLKYTGSNQIQFLDYLEATGFNFSDILDNIEEEDTSLDVMGCTYAEASNYNPDATIDDGSCVFDNDSGLDYIPGDINGDGVLNVLDIVTIMNEILNPTTVSLQDKNSNFKISSFHELHLSLLKSYKVKDAI